MEDRGAKPSITDKKPADAKPLGGVRPQLPFFNEMLAFGMKIRDERGSSAKTVHKHAPVSAWDLKGKDVFLGESPRGNLACSCHPAVPGIIFGCI